jgi:hypothetical protein
MQGPIELSAGASSVLDTRSPHLHDHSASIETPPAQLRGELRIRLRRDGQLALFTDDAIGGYTALDPTQAPVRQGRARSTGVALRYTIHPDETPFTIGLGAEALLWSIPFVEYRTCVSDCGDSPIQDVTRGQDTVAALAFALVPAYRSGPWTFYGGLYFAPHPTVRRKGTELGIDYDGDTESGEYNMIVHAGVEYSLRQLSVLAQVQKDMVDAPASYGPSFGFAIAGRLPSATPMH